VIEEFLFKIGIEHVLLFVAILMFINAVASIPPSEIIIATSAVAIGQENVQYISLMFIIALSANLGGAIILYWVGYHYRDRILAWLPRLPFAKEVPINDLVLYLLKHTQDGHRAWICVTRFTPTIRSISSLPAGMSRVKFATYVAYSTLGCSVWIAIWIWIGLLFYEIYSQFQWIGFFVAFVVLAFVYALAKRASKTRRSNSNRGEH